MVTFLIVLITLSMNMDELSASLHLETGMAYLNQGLPEQAEEEFNTVLDIGDDFPEAILGLGLVDVKRGSFESAAEHFRQYMETCPDDYRGYLELAKLFLETGKPDSAAPLAETAFDLSPGEPPVWMICGKINMELDDPLAAEHWFERGVSLGGGDSAMDFTVLLARVYRLTGRSQEARNLLLPAVEAGYAPACWELVKVYLEWEDYLRAGDAIKRYLFLEPEGTFADSAILVLEELGESGRYMYRQP